MLLPSAGREIEWEGAIQLRQSSTDVVLRRNAAPVEKEYIES
jgi:hypothetical protein